MKRDEYEVTWSSEDPATEGAKICTTWELAQALADEMAADGYDVEIRSASPHTRPR